MNTNYENPENISVFSPSHLIKHSISFLKTQYDFNFYYPYAALIGITGIIGFGYFTYLMVKNVWPLEKSQKYLAWISLACFAGYWLLVNSYYLGDPVQAVSSRFFALSAMVLSLLCVMLLARIPLIGKTRIYAVIIAAALFLIYNPVSIENRFSSTLSAPREYRHAVEFLKNQGSTNIMIIAETPVQFTVLNYGAVSFEYAREYPDNILTGLKNHLYEHIYVIQHINYQTLKPEHKYNLPANFDLQPVFEIQNSNKNFVRISKIIPLAENNLPASVSNKKTAR